MSKKDKIEGDEKVVERDESPARVAFRLLIERYKKQSPAKYELKKDELEAKLSKIA